MHTPLIDRLQAERAHLWHQQKALLDTAESEKRDLSGVENREYDQRDQRMNDIDARLSELQDDAQRAATTQQAVSKLLNTPVDPRYRAPRSAESEQLRAFANGQGGRTLDIPGAPVDFRALSKLSATAGLNTVPTSFYDKLVAHMIEVSGILQAGPTVLTTDSGETMQIPVTTAHSTATLVAEGGTISTSEPTFGQRALGAYKYALLIQVSRELMADTGVDLEGYLAMQAGRAAGNAFGTHAITGTGSSQPSGVLTGASLGVTGGTGVSGAFTSDNIIDLMFSVIAPYRNRPSAAWLVKDSTLGSVRKLKDSTGQYLWQPSLQLGVPDTLLGKPVYTDPNVPAVAVTNKSVVFGDMSSYFVRLAGGVRFERSDDFAFSTDLVTFRMVMRADGVLADQTGAVKYFVGAST